MRSMVEWEARRSAGQSRLSGCCEACGLGSTSGVSLTTTLRVVPLSQEGEESPFWRPLPERTDEPWTIH